MIRFSGTTVSIDQLSIDMAYPIEEAFDVNGKVIVLFNPDAFIEKFGQFNNICALDSKGRRLWTADLPTTDTGDCYYKIASRAPLIAYSVCSYECEIDIETGRIKRRT